MSLLIGFLLGGLDDPDPTGRGGGGGRAGSSGRVQELVTKKALTTTPMASNENVAGGQGIDENAGGKDELEQLLQEAGVRIPGESA